MLPDSWLVWVRQNLIQIIAVIVAFVVFMYYFRGRREENKVVPPPTPAEYEAAAKTPRFMCKCWDTTLNQCLPEAVCIIRRQNEGFKPK